VQIKPVQIKPAQIKPAQIKPAQIESPLPTPEAGARRVLQVVAARICPPILRLCGTKRRENGCRRSQRP